MSDFARLEDVLKSVGMEQILKIVYFRRGGAYHRATRPIEGISKETC